MWKGYTARDAAQLIGLSESAVQDWIRDGVVGESGDAGAMLSFRDLAALRAAKVLVDAGEPPSRVREQLTEVRARSHQRTVSAEPAGGDGARNGRKGRGSQRSPVTVGAGSAQLALPFAVKAPREIAGGDVVDLPRVPHLPGLVMVPPATADQWLARAQALEPRDSIAAIDAYRRSLRLRPDCSEAWVNLGRLLAETNDPQAAQECFNSALELDPDEPAAYYNLGVLAHDAGQTGEAIEFYRKSLELDAQLAEAHYNLATLFDLSGDSRSAIRHINEYRKLTR